MKVMVVDDSSTIRHSIKKLLADEKDCQVVAAVDGYDALTKLVTESPNLIFIDIMMPRLDGYQACALIKNNPDYAGIPIIMLSSKDGLFDRARGRIVGADQYLTKPFNKEQLVEAYRQYTTTGQPEQ